MEELQSRAADCLFGQELVYVSCAMQNLFSFFFIAFERLVASRRTATYGNAKHGHRLGLASIVGSCLLTSTFWLVAVGGLRLTPHGGKMLAFCNSTNAVPVVVILIGALQVLPVEVAAVYVYVALRRFELDINTVQISAVLHVPPCSNTKLLRYASLCTSELLKHTIT